MSSRLMVKLDDVPKQMSARVELSGPTGWVQMLCDAFTEVLGPRKRGGNLILETSCSGTGSVAYGLRVCS